jgi:carboxyl-terminal processing protease
MTIASLLPAGLPPGAHPSENLLLKKTCWLLFAIALNVPAAEIAPQPWHLRAASAATALIGHYHYQPQALDDTLSAAIFDRYLKLLDPEKFIFTQADIDKLAEYRHSLDDALLTPDLTAPFAIFNRYQQRMGEHFTYARSLLKAGFTFDSDEHFNYGRDKADWAGTDDILNDLWRQRVKNDWLRLKLASKTDGEIRSTLDKRYEQSIKRLDRLKSDDAFQTFMNAYAMTIEPHTAYLGPRASADFDISMRLSLTGIGATLWEKNDYTVIRELTPGSPASLSGKLHPGDRIVGVAQGSNEPFVDIIGWRLDDTVALIRGEADSVVRLDILPASGGAEGEHRVVKLVRKKIDLAQQAAKKTILDVADGKTKRRIGIITLPTFYEDFSGRHQGDPGARSASRDVALQLEELKKAKVDGVIIDLRRNGGGSLKEAIALSGLFIDTGPVVMERDARGRVFVDGDTVPGSAWDGPLGILIDGESASASEIFAAAMQDYGRGIVIGEQSYGKGTVQSLIDLNRVVPDEKTHLGELRLTVAQFFRINGSTTQLRGVQPDIAFPASNDPSLTGEASNDNALPWTRIRASAYERTDDIGDTLPEVMRRHEQRAANDPAFRKLAESSAELLRLRQQTNISLNEIERRRENQRQEKLLLEGGRPDDGLQENERDEKIVHKEPDAAKDIRLLEAARIVADEAALVARRPRSGS